ncbi:MAG: SUMF1/EgtB/PvdO family nonheme iron enzyme [Candidatus Poribacteria bacterium]|nr:SUMF1/EgtB/PvdO family nonheme iron enzyme [Candidatus Poribacteria bacterium]
MHKAIQYILICVAMGIFISTAPAQDAFDKTVAQIKALETKLEQNRKRVEQETTEFRKNHKDNAPQDMFESDAMYKERMAKLDVTVSEHRLKLLKESIEAHQIEHARLHREHILSDDITVTLSDYDANNEFFPITIETSTERFTERLDIKRDDARLLYENWGKVSKQGYLTVGPAPTYKRMLAKVTLAYPDIWRKPVLLYLNNSDTMVLIPAGNFEMGISTPTDPETLHTDTVYLDAFYIDKYEVTVGQYKQFIQATGHRDPDWNKVLEFSPTDQHPIIYVSWYDAMEYAKWAGKRLPTYAESQKAARGGLVGAKYAWGDAAPNGTQCNFADKSSGRSWADKSADDGYQFTAPVGSFPGNRYGLFDMAGNVMEWCLDGYSRGMKDYSSDIPRRNPIGGANSIIAVINDFSNNNLTNRFFSSIHDSSWFRGDAVLLQGRIQLVSESTLTSDETGFRCVRSVTP